MGFNKYAFNLLVFAAFLIKSVFAALIFHIGLSTLFLKSIVAKKN